MIILFLILTEQLTIQNKLQETPGKKVLLLRQADFNRGCCDLDKFPARTPESSSLTLTPHPIPLLIKNQWERSICIVTAHPPKMAPTHLPAKHPLLAQNPIHSLHRMLMTHDSCF